MPNWTGYEPMPGMPFGTGMFTDANGTKGGPYHLPDDAIKLAQAPQLETSSPVMADVPPPMAPPAPIPAPPPVGVGRSVDALPKDDGFYGKLNDEEKQAVTDLAARHPGTTPDDYLKVFNKESGLNASAINPKSGAKGLFQWMPDQAPADFEKLSRADQIRQFDKYLQVHNVDPKTGSDVGMAVAAPAFAGKPDEAVAYPAGSKEAKANPTWQDANGNVTVGSLKKNYGFAGGATGGGPPVSPEVADAARAYSSLGSPSKMVDTVKTSTRTESGQPFDQAGFDAKTAASKQELLNSNNAVVAAREAQQNALDLQNLDLKDRADAARERETMAAADHKAFEGRIREKTQEYINDKAPPPFEGAGFAAILAGISAGLGAFFTKPGETNTGQRGADQIMQTVEQVRARDQKAWEQKHLDKKYGVEQEKELEKNQWYEYKEAMLTRRAEQDSYLAHTTQAMAARVQGAEKQATLLQAAAKFQADRDQTSEQYARLAKDKIMTTQEVDSQKTDGVANTPEAQRKLMETRIALGHDAVTENAGYDLVNGTHTTPAIKPEVMAKYTGGYGTGQGKVVGREALDNAETVLKDGAAAAGMVFDEKTQSFKPGKENLKRWPGGAVVGPTALGVASMAPMLTGVGEENLNASQKVQTLLNQAMALQSGLNVTDNEVIRDTNEILGRSPVSMAESLTDKLRKINSNKKSLAAAFPAAHSTYEANTLKDGPANAAPTPQAASPDPRLRPVSP